MVAVPPPVPVPSQENILMLKSRPSSYVAAALAGAALLTATGGTRAKTVTTVMRGLDNPRGLAVGPEGALYVAEAGRGGDGPGITVRSDFRSYGPTGAVTRLWRGRQERLASGLPSLIGQRTREVTGPHDISLLGRGQAYVTIGLGFDPTRRSELGPVGEQFGRLARVLPNGRWRIEEDLGAYEVAANPDGLLPDSNPYGLLSLPGGRVVADAGANALLGVAANGRIGTLAVFPFPPNPTVPRVGPPVVQPVPTSVAVGPDGALYVGLLTGFPFPVGGARVFRVVPGQGPEVYLAGFTTIIDLDFGSDGSLYVLQHATGPAMSGPGALIRVASGGARATLHGGLDHPTSTVVGPDGAVYVTNRGTSVGVGEVLRIGP